MTQQSALSPEGLAMPERRSLHRRRMLKGAILRFNRGYSALDSVVRNISDSGAQLALGETTGVPAHFQLHISGEETARRARLVWRSAERIGIAFND